MQPSSTPSSVTSGPDLRINPSRHRCVAVALLVGLLLCGPVLLAVNGHPGAALVLLLVLLVLCHDLPRQPWLGCRLNWHGGAWWWSEGDPSRSRRVDILRYTMASPLATCVRLREPVSGRSWWLNLFHDSVSRDTLSALRRRLIVQG